jgi:hypothetical protein
MNVLNVKILFSALSKFQIIVRNKEIKGNSINNCDFLKVSLSHYTTTY